MKKIFIRYNNKRFISKAKHPRVDFIFRQRILLGYDHVAVLGNCETCGGLITSLDECIEDDGCIYCDTICQQ